MQKRKGFWRGWWWVLLTIFLTAGGTTVFAEPADQGFDGASIENLSTSSGDVFCTIGDLTYTSNSATGKAIQMTTVSSSQALYFGSSGVADLTEATFGTTDGSKFKLNSFYFDIGNGAGALTIEGWRDGAFITSYTYQESFFSDVYDDTFSPTETAWESIDTVKIKGADLDIAIDDLDFSPAVTYNVTYNSNGGTGTPPDASVGYLEGDVTLSGNTNNMTNLGYVFDGWNTSAEGTGTDYAVGSTYTLGSSDVELYAKWISGYIVTYHGTDATCGEAPTQVTYLEGSTVTVEDEGTLARLGYTFNNWATVESGDGTAYGPSETFEIGTSDVDLYAQWTWDEYAITYEGNDNTGGCVPSDANIYHYGDIPTVLGNTGNLVKDGYVFAGWSLNSDGSGTLYQVDNSLPSIEGNTTLYAVWKHTITYDGNGNDAGTAPTDSTLYNQDEEVTLAVAGDLAKTGATFVGWNTASDGSGTTYAAGGSYTMGSSNATLYALWGHTVSYNGNGATSGTAPTGGTYAQGVSLTVADKGTLAKPGYTFSGWNTEAGGDGDSYVVTSPLTMGNSAVTLYAQWTQDNYSITYDGNDETGGSVPTDSGTYHYGNTPTVFGNTGTLVKDGYVFAGWSLYLDGSGTLYQADNSLASIEGNTTLYAVWKHTITYDGNGNDAGTVPTDSTLYNQGEAATLAVAGDLAKTGATFVGWNTASDGSGTTYAVVDTYTMGDTNTTLYALWGHTVSYDGNGATSGSAPASTVYGQNVTVIVADSGTLVKNGYTFSNWDTVEGGGGIAYNIGNTFAMGTDDITLYAQWTQDNYSITYDGNEETGGSVPTDSGTYHYGDSPSVLGNTGYLVRTNYVFAGWSFNEDGSGTLYQDGDSLSEITGSKTLYAVWKHSITYDGNGETSGTAPTDGTLYNQDETVTLAGAGDLMQTDGTFVGWNTAADGSGTAYATSDTYTMGSRNVTLYALWGHTVSYNGNSATSGTVPASETYGQGTTVTVADSGTLAKLGNTFSHWDTVQGGGGITYAVGENFVMGDNAVTLYAQWEQDIYQLTYDANYGSGTEPTDSGEYHYNDDATVEGSNGLTFAGYTFGGWTLNSDGSGTVYGSDATTSLTMTGDTTLYAKWNPIEYTITYHDNGADNTNVPVDSVTHHVTDSVTVKGNENGLTKLGSTFDGWNTAANGTGDSYDASGTDSITMPAGNVDLYAQWTEDVYHLTYNTNGGSGTAPTDTADYNYNDSATVKGKGEYIFVGYTFGGWTLDSEGTGTVYGPSATTTLTMTANQTLYAYWVPVDYSVTYDDNGSDGGLVPEYGNYYHINDQVMVAGNTGNLVKTGYVFDGWNTASNGLGDSYAITDTLIIGSSDVTLYAKWVEATSRVTYLGNGNSSGDVPKDTADYHNGDAITVLGNTGTLSKTGYTFDGWNTLANGNGIDYAAGGTLTIGTSDVLLFAQWKPIDYTVTYSGNGNTSGTVPTDSNVYNITGSVTVLRNTGGLTKSGYNFVGWNTLVDGNGTTYAAGTTFKMGNSDVILYAKWKRKNKSSGGSGGSSSTATATTQTNNNGSTIIVDGESQDAGSETTTTENGTTTVTVEVHNEVLESEIDEAITSSLAGTKNLVQISISDTNSEVAKVNLLGDIVNKLKENSYDISITRDNIEYVIPAEELTIMSVAENFGVSENNLDDIKVEVTIRKLDEGVVEKYNKIVKANGAELVFPPVSFEVVAKTTMSNGTTSETEINKFSNYVERIMEIPDDVNPENVTTGIVFNPDGTYSQVPTEIFQKDGKWYAKLSSLTNSEYSLISNSLTVQTVENHWSKDAVNDLASRNIIFNTENFAPDEAITRADFAEYIVRALGLYRTGSEHENNYNDLSATGDRTLAILIASEYDIVSGYSDGTFKPGALITREEAMSMYQRAMKITNLEGTDVNRYQSYTDYNQVGSWATTNVKAVLSAHVFNGTTATTISPKSNLTYAEAAVAIKNLLVKSNLINQ